MARSSGGRPARRPAWGWLIHRKNAPLQLFHHTRDTTKIAKSMQKGIHRKEGGSKPEDLFVGRTPQQVINDLYTLDLKTIIVAHWDTFAPLFGGNKGRFEMNMDTLNKARRIDAHAKPIPPVEAEEIGNSYAWLRARLGSIPPL